MMAWMLSTAAFAGACSIEQAEQSAEALAATPPDLRGQLAAIGISEDCPGAPFLAEAAGRFTQGAVEARRAADKALAVTDPGAWSSACEGGDRALQEASELPEADQRWHLWSACGLASRGWFTEDEWKDSDGAIVIALIAGVALEDSDVPPETTKALVRALSGVQVGSSRTEATFTEGGRVEPKWSRRARKSGGTCVARIGVAPRGKLRKVVFLECPEGLQRAVQEAVEASTLRPASEGGENVPGRFEAAYSVEG